MLGKIVSTIENLQTTNSNKVTIDLNTLQKGLFFINLTFEDRKVITKKLNIFN